MTTTCSTRARVGGRRSRRDGGWRGGEGSSSKLLMSSQRMVHQALQHLLQPMVVDEGKRLDRRGGKEE